MSNLVGIHVAKARLCELVRRAETGGEIVIARRGKPVARLVPFENPTLPRRPGRLKGLIALDDTFWEPSSNEEAGED